MFLTFRQLFNLSYSIGAGYLAIQHIDSLCIHKFTWHYKQTPINGHI